MSHQSCGVQSHVRRHRDHTGLSIQVGVIRPISRDHDAFNKTSELMSQSDIKTNRDNFNSSENKLKSNGVHVSNLNKINNNKNVEREPIAPKVEKETLIIEKDPLFVPVESWIENNTQVNVSTSAAEMFIHKI